jgi:hypothetical protein
MVSRMRALILAACGLDHLVGLDACSVLVDAVRPGLLAPSEMLAVVARVLNVSMSQPGGKVGVAEGLAVDEAI